MTSIPFRLFLGHQSVGADLIAGLQAMSSESFPTPAVTELQAPRATGLPAGVLHARLGRNTDPASKLDDFERWLGEGLGESVDFAMLKFCYVDVMDSRGAARLFDDYLATVERIAMRFPRLSLIHCTIPLRVLPHGPYALLRRLLSHRHPEFERNTAREHFNEHLRVVGDGRHLFDLALIESRDARAHKRISRAVGAQVPGLLPVYSHDGGHLNAAGRRVVAGEFRTLLDSLGARR